MRQDSTTNTNHLLRQAHAGDREAFDQLYTRLYGELRAIARRQRRRQGARDTLDTSSVVHEAYTRLVDERDVSWEDRAHFLAIAARTMRRVIVDYARNRGAWKRGRGWSHVTMPLNGPRVEQRLDDLLAIDGALTALAAFDRRLERVAECRLFGDLTHEETASALGVSLRTVQRDWQRARAWLQRALDP